MPIERSSAVGFPSSPRDPTSAGEAARASVPYLLSRARLIASAEPLKVATERGDKYMGARLATTCIGPNREVRALTVRSRAPISSRSMYTIDGAAAAAAAAADAAAETADAAPLASPPLAASPTAAVTATSAAASASNDSSVCHAARRMH